jgi:hypothetical protein
MVRRTLTGTRFDMSAVILHQNQEVPPAAEPINLDDYGTWTNHQDPLTGEIVRIWVPWEVPPDPNNPPPEPVYRTIDCVARGVVDGGIRVAGTTEWFGVDYKNIDFVKMWVPPNVEINKRDRVTNITDKFGHIAWLDEEFDDPNDLLPPKATVFNVNGVTPLFNAFNRMVEKFVMLERAEV